MKLRRNANQAMLKQMGGQSLLLAAAVTLIVALSPQNSPAGKEHYGRYHHAKDRHSNLSYGSVRYGNDRDEMPFKDAEFFIEYNASAGDTGVQVFLDDDNWRRITISDPKDKILFMVEGRTTLGRQGLTELFFESVEPELASLPIVKFLRKFPEGDYEFEGIRNDGIKLESDVAFTHVMPCGPEVWPEEGTILNPLDPDFEVIISWEEVDEVVDPAATDAAGETVCTDPEDLLQDLEIDIYQVIVENDDVHLIVDLPAEARSLTIPPEIIEMNRAYKFEVLAKEESGNQTITEGFFCTGPDITEAEDCEALADVL